MALASANSSSVGSAVHCAVQPLSQRALTSKHDRPHPSKLPAHSSKTSTHSGQPISAVNFQRRSLTNNENARMTILGPEPRERHRQLHCRQLPRTWRLRPDLPPAQLPPWGVQLRQNHRKQGSPRRWTRTPHSSRPRGKPHRTVSSAWTGSRPPSWPPDIPALVCQRSWRSPLRKERHTLKPK